MAVVDSSKDMVSLTAFIPTEKALKKNFDEFGRRR